MPSLRGPPCPVTSARAKSARQQPVYDNAMSGTATEIPKITDWMQAWGSIAAALMGALAVVVTGLLLRHEMNARREEREEQRIAPARLVISSTGYLRSRTKAHDEGYGKYEHVVERVGWKIVNYGSSPIFDIEVSMQYSLEKTTGLFLSLFTAPWEYVETRAVPVADILDGSGSLEGYLAAETSYYVLRRRYFRGTLRIYYTDSSGNRWTRLGKNQPIPYSSRPRLSSVPRPHEKQSPQTTPVESDEPQPDEGA